MIVPVYGCVAVTNSALGLYPITITLNDSGNRLTNYVVTTNEGTLVVYLDSPEITAQPTNTTGPGAGGLRSARLRIESRLMRAFSNRPNRFKDIQPRICPPTRTHNPGPATFPVALAVRKIQATPATVGKDQKMMGMMLPIHLRREVHTFVSFGPTTRIIHVAPWQPALPLGCLDLFRAL